MKIPDPRHERRSQSEPYTEEATFYSSDTEVNGQPARTYHVRRVDVGGGWSYTVSMEVIAKQAAEDVLGRKADEQESTRTLWDEIWDTFLKKP
jgi:hypothetical protein